jgi:mRNA interferase RelE/StbE
MKVEFQKSFLSELRKLKDKSLKGAVANCILQVETAQNLSQIRNLKKLVGYDVYYRIRIRNYRIGVKKMSMEPIPYPKSKK